LGQAGNEIFLQMGLDSRTAEQPVRANQMDPVQQISASCDCRELARNRISVDVTKKIKKRDGIAPVASQLLFLAGPGAESALVQSVKSLAGDPSEVTALGVRHWITSFRC
jgi:hypothetical protein